MVAATPSGITLAPEGGAHQSIATPLIGIAQDGRASFEPAFVDELATIMRWGFDHMQRDRWRFGLSAAVDAPARPAAAHLTPDLQKASSRAATGCASPGRMRSRDRLYRRDRAGGDRGDGPARRDPPGHRPARGHVGRPADGGWPAARQLRRDRRGAVSRHIEQLLAPLSRDCGLVTVIDGHPSALAWLGGVHGHRVDALGVDISARPAPSPTSTATTAWTPPTTIDAAESLTVGAACGTGRWRCDVLRIEAGIPRRANARPRSHGSTTCGTTGQ